MKIKLHWFDMDKKEYKEGLTDEELRDDGIFTWFNNHPEYIFYHSWSFH